MKIRIAQATIVDQNHPDNGQVKDLLIEGGKIVKVADKISDDADEVIAADGLCVSIGWMDMRANFCDPGDEVKEDLESGLAAAANGGFTSVALSPATIPVVDQKSLVKYSIEQSRYNAVEIIPVGTVSKKMEGKNLSEMYDMYQAGARAFSDEKHSIRESGLLQRALLYTKSFGAPIMHFPFDNALIPNGQMNEGELSTTLGLKGMPAVAEEMVVRRDLTLLEYTDGKLHLGPLSSAASLDLVEDAKSKGLNVTCETTAAHIAFNDCQLENFDSQFKLQPPLRSAENQVSLMEHLKAGRIDVISSDHAPTDEENKKLEFDHAEFGQAGIETFFPTLWNACSGKIELDKLVATFSSKPREILGLEIPEIKEGAVANLTLFCPDANTQVDSKKMHTKAYNVLPDGMQMKGSVVGIISRGKLVKAEA